MSAPAKCPGCSTKLLPEWESCPNCPMSFRDAAPEKTAFESDAFHNYLMPVLLLGGFGYFIWILGGYMLSTADQAAKPVPKDVKPSLSGPPPGGLVNEQATGKFDPTGAAPLLENPKAAKAEKGSEIVSVMPDEGLAQKIVREWKLRGGIYDLLTLKPVPGAAMVFTDNISNERVQIKADSQGRYRAILPPLVGGGYIVTLSQPGYQSTYLDPGIEGVSDLPIKRRTELAKDLSSLISQPFTFEAETDAPVVADFYLAPK